jgi:SAM-dependent methyltransferase
VGEIDVKREVQAFYDSVGWTVVGDGLYQNARYEDLRPVSREYIHRCHLRVGRRLPARGERLLDAGSGPVQYPEYLEYSRGFGRRVCLDISRRALTEARARLGGHGAYVVGDLASLPFRREAFEGVVSLHTLHHLPAAEHGRGLEELYRVLAPRGRAVVVYAWGDGGLLMRLMARPARWARSLLALRAQGDAAGPSASASLAADLPASPTGTRTYKHNYRWAKEHLAFLPVAEILVWRSVNTGFLRTFIQARLAGRLWLRWLFRLEEAAPRLMGRIGQYPMFVFSKPGRDVPERKTDEME